MNNIQKIIKLSKTKNIILRTIISQLFLYPNTETIEIFLKDQEEYEKYFKLAEKYKLHPKQINAYYLAFKVNLKNYLPKKEEYPIKCFEL